MAKILVLEDEDDLREIIDEELTEFGHSAVAFSRGQEALDYLTGENVDLILSDITMPQMTGYQFFRNLREQLPQHTQTPFIFMTALSDRENEIKGLRLGVDDYITKPIDYDLMLLRVEGHLRRRQAMADAAPPPATRNSQAKASPTGGSDPEQAAKLKAMLQENDGRVMASRFVKISLEAVRERVGDSWSEMSDKITQNAELVIRAHLGPKDIFSVTPSNDFLVCFAGLDEEELKAKTSQIRDELWERLFSVTQDEELSSIEAQSHELSLDFDTIDEDNIFLEADKAIDQENKKDIESKKKQLEQIYSFETFLAYPLIGTTGGASKIKALSFNKKIMDKVRSLSFVGDYDTRFFLDLQKIMIQRLEDMPKFTKAFAQHAILLPVGFPLLRNPEAREELTALCKGIEKKLDSIVIIEVINAPDRLKPYKDVLKPLPVGRQLQFIEIGRPKQAEGIALDKIGVAYVSMSFSKVMTCHSKELAQFNKTLESQGVKLYIKDIPEGKLLKAQGANGKLFSMWK